MNNTVVIIDSGINNEICGDNIIGGICFTYNNNEIIQSQDYYDDNGHGTACYCIISSIARDSKFYIIKILNDIAKTSVDLLIAALEHCLSLECNVINLSLATLNEDNINELEKVCQKLNKQGKIIVASVFNRHKSSYPASFNSVIGVRGNTFNNQNQFWFNKEQDIECIADIIPQFTKRSLDNYMLFGGNSKACACMTGNIVNIIKDNYIYNLDSVKKILQKKAVKNHWTESDIEVNLPWQSVEDADSREYTSIDLERIKSSIYKVVEDPEVLDLKWNDNLYEKGIITSCNCKAIIEGLEGEYNIKIKDSYINFCAFLTIKSLFKLVKG